MGRWCRELDGNRGSESMGGGVDMNKFGKVLWYQVNKNLKGEK